jgi:hypothetical protein
MSDRPHLTPYDNFLYLTAEIEAALGAGTIDWPPGSGDLACQRYVAILAALVQTAPLSRVH